MIPLDKLTVLIITFNEEANIGRTLDSLRWANQILVIDSFSTDATVSILEQYPNVRLIQREFTDFADQCNFGLSQVVTIWVLSIDADYVFPGQSEEPIRAAIDSGARALQAEFKYLIQGQPVHGSILPPRTVLYQVKGARYVKDGHGHRVVLDGPVETLSFKIGHDDRKPLSRWFQSQINYARQEAEKLSATPNFDLGRNDRIRLMIVFAPILVFILSYIIRGGFLSGWRGLFYAGQRFFAEILLSLFLLDRKLSGNDSN